MKQSRLVFSTEAGRVAASRQPASSQTPRIRQDVVVRVFRERAGRKGKVVTVVRGLPERGAALDARAAELRRLCGAGGTVKDGAVEVQGDHRERIADHVRGLGYTVKLAGG
jgi:translation initiation factor 1